MLKNRNLYDLAIKRIEQAIPQSIEENKPDILLELFRIRNLMLFTEEESFLSANETMEVIEKAISHASFLRIATTLESIQYVLAYLINHLSTEPNKFLDLVEERLLSEDIKIVLTSPFFNYKLIYYTSLSHYYRLKNDMVNLLKSQQQVFSLVKKEYANKKGTEVKILAVMYNFFGTCLHLKEYRLLYKEYNWYVQNIEVKGVQEKNFNFGMFHEFYFKISNNTNYISFDKNAISRFEKGIKEIKFSLNGISAAMLISEIIQYAFKNKMYSKCVQYIYKFEQLPSNSIYDKITPSLEVGRLLCYLETDDFQTLEKEFKYFNDKEETDLFKIAFQEFFSKTIKYPDQKRKLKKGLNKKLEELKENPDYEYCFKVVDFFEWGKR